MTDLSPAAQAVLDACETSYTESGLVAALRVAAAHLPSSAMYPSSDWGHGWRTGINDARQVLLSIAAELEELDG